MGARRGSGRGSLAALAAVAAGLLVGCGSVAPTGSPAPSPTLDCADPGVASHVVVRWFMGLGSGMQPDQLEAEKAFVARYNAARCDRPYIVLEAVPNAAAYDVLTTEISAGTAPDIIGPVGFRGRNGFGGLFLDLAPLVAGHKTDLSGYEPAVMDLLKDPRDGQVGLPYTMYPGFIFYNKTLFKAAGLPDLPHRVGEQYQGRDWTWETLAAVAAQLTLDTDGKASTDPGFDPNKVVQYGFDFEFADARRIASCFGGGSFVGADGRTAQIPAAWRSAWNWWYDAMWKQGIAPHANAFGSGSMPFMAGIGRVAMEPMWPWVVGGLVSPPRPVVMLGRMGRAFGMGLAAGPRFSWDIAVMPSHGGATSSPLDADTFVISKATARPDDAYLAMLAIMADPTLKAVYGGMPALKSEQSAYFGSLDAQLAPAFSGNVVDWSVLQEMAAYPAVPSHEADMPNATKAIDLYGVFAAKLESRSGLEVDSEIDKLRAGLQAAFDMPVSSPSS